MLTPLAYEPELLPALKARYPAALDQLYDVEAMNLGTQLYPGAKRRHVFDFCDGCRLTVLLSRQADGKKYIHCSSSIMNDTPLQMKFENLVGEQEQATILRIFIQTGFEHFHKLSDNWDDHNEKLFFITPDKFIPNWFIPFKDQPA